MFHVKQSQPRSWQERRCAPQTKMARKRRDYMKGPAPTPRELAGLVWRVVRPLLVRVLWIIGLVVLMSTVTFLAARGCGG